MVRIAVTVYLILAALLGPGLYCCTTVRLLAGGPRQGCSTLEKEQSQLESRRRCGCNHPQRDPDSLPQPADPSDESPSCPCKDHKTIPVAVLATDSQLVEGLFSALHERALETILPAHSASASSLLDGFRVSPERRTPPFQTARVILRALQTMRC